MSEEILQQVMMSAMMGGRPSPTALDPVIFNALISELSKSNYCKE
jgi:hypothetical protein